MAMNRFDELVDEFIYKARTAADVASRKTSEMVEVGRLKYQAKQTTWDIEKTYSKLGAIVYESKKSDEDFEEIINVAVSELDGMHAKLEDLEAKIAAYQKDSASPRPATAKEEDAPVEESAPVEEAPQEAPSVEPAGEAGETEE